MKTSESVTIRIAWKHFIHHHDLTSRNTVIEYYLPLVKYIAMRLHARLPKCVELDDLYSVGIVGLINAVEKFDPSHHVTFKCYCAQRIQGAILDDIRKMDWVPRLVREHARQLQKARRKLEAVFGRYPSEEELAAELGLEMKDFYHFQRDANAAALLSLNTPLSDLQGEGECTGLNFIADTDSRNSFIDTNRRELLEHVKKGFSRQEQDILIMYYFEGMTLKEIGETLGKSEARICQLHSSMIARLRDHVEISSLCLS